MTHATQHTAPKPAQKKGWFTCFAQGTSNWAGSQSAFMLAFGAVLLWALTGPLFRYSEAWQMVINTGTTIITFLMVFLIQNSQNRDGKVTQLKLDELIRALEGAENALINMEEMTESELEATHAKFIKLAEQAASVRGGRGGSRTAAVAAE
jgi:low affinity Fe/Cu permease